MPDPAEPNTEPAVDDNDDANLDSFGQTIKDVQIFRSGSWNGKSYTNKDIDEIIAASTSIGYKAPVTLGHTDDPSAPAYGYAVNLRRDGDYLIADFEDVPDDLVSQIRDKRYDTVSSEIFFDLKRGAKTYRRALRSVAVLGAHPPGVSDLKPLSAALGALAENEPYVSVDYRPGSPDMPTTDNSNSTSAENIPANPPTPEQTPVPTTTQQHVDQSSEIARLQEALRAASAATVAAQNEAAAARAVADASGTSQLTIQRLQEQARASEMALARIHEQARQDRIDVLVQSAQRPALRGHIRALAELATQGDRPGTDPATVQFQAQGADAPSPTSAVRVLEDLVRLLNQSTEHLFEERVEQGDMSRKFAASFLDDPGSQLMELTTEYVRQHPGTNPDLARHAIMNDPKNRDLVRRYNTVLSGVN